MFGIAAYLLTGINVKFPHLGPNTSCTIAIREDVASQGPMGKRTEGVLFLTQDESTAAAENANPKPGRVNGCFMARESPGSLDTVTGKLHQVWGA